MGSGIFLNYAKEKYGLNNFEKEILQFFENEKDMFNAEKRIVNEEFLLRDDVYNLVTGGCGWFPKNSEQIKQFGQMGAKAHFEKYGSFHSPNMKEWLISDKNITHLRKIGISKIAIENRKKTYKKIGHQQKEKNSMFGTLWITNGEISKRIHKNEEIPKGWRKGRIMKDC